MRTAPERGRRALRAVLAGTLALGLLYAALLVPPLRPVTGSWPLVDVWLNMLVDAGVLAVVVVRATLDRRDRGAWLLLATGLGAAFAASTLYFAHLRFLDPIPSPSPADAGWLCFYLLLAAGLLQLLRSRVRRMLRSAWLDGLIAGLTAAALADAYLDGAGVPVGDGARGVAAAYPLADLLLLAIGVAALAVLGRAAGPSWWLLCTSFVTFVVTDAVYAQQVAAGTYTPGDPVDVGWLLARLLLALAAVASLRERGRPRDLQGAAVLALPGACALTVLALLLHGTQHPLPTAATVLAALAGCVMVVRTAFTFRELKVLTERTQQALIGRLVEAQEDERARIAADVHDDSLQALAAVDLRLGSLRRRLAAHAPAEVPAVSAVTDTVHEAAVRLRSLLFELETPALEAELPEALREAAAHVFEDADVTWSVVERGRGSLPRATRVSAYRIAREALVNVRKHAGARTVVVTVDVRPGGVEVAVLDDGVGLDATTGAGSRRRHSGVTGMRDRAAAASGWWRSGPGPDGAGTCVRFWLPSATGPAPGGAGSADEQAADDVRRPRDADDELTLDAAAEQGREVVAEHALEQVGGRPGGQHPQPGRGVRLP